jgi:hypothetical protein
MALATGRVPVSSVSRRLRWRARRSQLVRADHLCRASRRGTHRGRSRANESSRDDKDNDATEPKLISIYMRSDALADGVLVDVSETAREAALSCRAEPCKPRDRSSTGPRFKVGHYRRKSGKPLLIRAPGWGRVVGIIPCRSSALIHRRECKRPRRLNRQWQTDEPSSQTEPAWQPEWQQGRPGCPQAWQKRSLGVWDPGGSRQSTNGAEQYPSPGRVFGRSAQHPCPSPPQFVHDPSVAHAPATPGHG